MRNRFTVRGLVAAVALVAAAPAAALALSVAPASASISPGPGLPPAPGTCTPTQVDTAELAKTDHGPVIRVTGVKAHADFVVRLDPDKVDFIRQPDYFPYTVSECGSGGPVVKTPFKADFAVPTNPVGRFGISVNDILVNLFPGAPATS